MEKFTDVVKRLLNVVVVLCTLFAAFLGLIVIFGAVANWSEFVISGVAPVVVVYAVVAGLNYILYGKVTLWHKATSGT